MQSDVKQQMAQQYPVPLAQENPDAAYDAAKTGLAVFNLAGLGVVQIRGGDAGELLHRLTINEMRNMPAGGVQINAFTDPKGKVVDAFLLIKRDDGFDLITSFNRAKSVIAWIDRYTFIEDIACTDVSDEVGSLLLTGPEVRAFLERGFSDDHVAQVSVGGCEVEAFAVHTLLPCGVLVLAPALQVERAMNDLVASRRAIAGANLAFHMLRVEQGVPFVGHELGIGVNPFESGLEDYINFDKGCYIGQEVIARLASRSKVKFAYVGFLLGGKAQPAVPVEIKAAGKTCGVMTSVAPIPAGRGWWGIGRIRRHVLENPSELSVEVDGELCGLRLRDFSRR